jgi:outer membrane protein insertion porin family
VRRALFTSLAAFLLLLVVNVPGLAQSNPFRPPTLPSGDVSEIRIEGTRRVEPSAVRNVLGTEVGEPIDRTQIRRDILAIRRLSTRNTPYFDDVQVDVAVGSDGLIVTYILVEKPIIAELDYRFVHNNDLENDLADVVDIEVGDVFDLARVRENVHKIEELYREKGYYLAEVDFEWVEIEDGDVHLTIVIEEYDEVEVRRVLLIGNEHLSDDDILGIIATRPGEILGFLSGAGVFNETEFSNDRRRIRALYYDYGYVDVEVSEPQVELSRDLTEIFITIPIVEGDRYRVRDVSITGDALVSVDDGTILVTTEELMQSFVRVSSADENFSSTAVRADIEALTAVYRDQGYANATITLGTDRDHETLEIGVTYDIQRGEPVYIGRIEIIGNDTTRDQVIRRELRIDESELYNGTGIRRSRARIERLGFFDEVVIREEATNEPNVMDLQVEVSERATGQFQVGAGFSSVESFIVTATISQNNLFGRGQTLSLQMSLSGLRSIFTIGFSEPYFFGSPWQFGFEIFNREILFTDFSRTSLGFSLTAGHPITDDVLVSVTYQLEDVEVQPGGRSGRTDRQLSNLFQGGLTSSVRTSMLWDTRNNRLFPSSGFLQSGSVELADAIFGSENQFLRFRLISRWYYELLSDLVLKFNATFGLVATTDPLRPVPIFERFFLGGPNSVRGFERSTLSPREPVAADPNDPSSFLVGFPIGGNKEEIFNVELEFPILTAIGLRGVFFMDAGNAFDENSLFTLDFDLFEDDESRYDQVLRTSVGFGFRWVSPLGPLRFEWGFPLQPLPSEESSVFEFSIGNFL